VSIIVTPDAFGICTYDLGKATGIAQGVFSNRGTVKQTLRRAVRRGMIRCSGVDGPPEEQGHYLAAIWRSFKFRCIVDYGIPEGAVLLVVEDFQLRQMAVDLAPVEVYAALRAVQRIPVTNGWHDDVRPECLLRQSASQAKTYATGERMSTVWGVSKLATKRVTGRDGDHAKDALRHLCSGVNKVLEGKWPSPKAG
jgi:hypothetical protein